MTTTLRRLLGLLKLESFFSGIQSCLLSGIFADANDTDPSREYELAGSPQCSPLSGV